MHGVTMKFVKLQLGEPISIINNNFVNKANLLHNLFLVYRISRPRKTHLFPRKMWPKFDLRLMRRGYYFWTYKYPYTFCMKKVTHRVKTITKTILVAVMTILWVSMTNKLYYGC